MVQYNTTGQYRISGFRQPGNNEYPDSIQYPDQSNLLHNRTNPEWLHSAWGWKVIITVNTAGQCRISGFGWISGPTLKDCKCVEE